MIILGGVWEGVEVCMGGLWLWEGRGYGRSEEVRDEYLKTKENPAK